MLAHHKRFATTPRRKRTRPSVGQIGPSAALRRLPDALHRAARRALPKEPICTHQIDSYLPRTALRAGAYFTILAMVWVVPWPGAISTNSTLPP